MLRFGYFDFQDDTLLIWGDSTGLSELALLFRRLATQKEQRTSLNAMEWAAQSGSIKVDFEARQNGPCVFQVSGAADVTILVACSPEQFAEFADKVAVLSAPDCVNGHQYLDAPSMADRQFIVSKGEYPEDFGSKHGAAI